MLARISIWVVLGWVLARMATCLFCRPVLPWLSNCTSMVPLAPGAMGSLVQLGVVQPHEAWAFTISRGDLPVLVKVNVCLTTSPGLMSPKLWVVSANVI